MNCPRCSGKLLPLTEEVDWGVGVETFTTGFECQGCGLQLSICSKCGHIEPEHETWCKEIL